MTKNGYAKCDEMHSCSTSKLRDVVKDTLCRGGSLWVKKTVKELCGLQPPKKTQTKSGKNKDVHHQYIGILCKRHFVLVDQKEHYKKLGSLCPPKRHIQRSDEKQRCLPSKLKDLFTKNTDCNGVARCWPKSGLFFVLKHPKLLDPFQLKKFNNNGQNHSILHPKLVSKTILYWYRPLQFSFRKWEKNVTKEMGRREEVWPLI